MDGSLQIAQLCSFISVSTLAGGLPTPLVESSRTQSRPGLTNYVGTYLTILLQLRSVESRLGSSTK